MHQIKYNAISFILGDLAFSLIFFFGIDILLITHFHDMLTNVHFLILELKTYIYIYILVDYNHEMCTINDLRRSSGCLC